jgi:hypothetical protein
LAAALKENSPGDVLVKVEHETAGQDLVLTKLNVAAGIRTVLAQFKFSSTKRAITAQELVEIAESLDIASHTIATSGQSFLLVTNRKLSVDPKKLPAGHSALLYRNPRTKKGKRSKSELKRLRLVLNAMRVEKASIDDWERSLLCVADQFGLSPAEYQRGVTHLVGAFLQAIAGRSSRSITIESFLELFVGFPSPRALALVSLGAQLLKEAEFFRRSTHAPKEIIRRSIVDAILKAAPHGLVIVHGDGGTGKSAALAEALGELGGLRAKPPSCYTWGEFATQLTDHWLGRVVGKWRQAPPSTYSSETPDASLARLKRAQPSSSQPALAIAIDAVDELGPERHERKHLLDIMRLAWDEVEEATARQTPTRFVCLMSCRCPSEAYDLWQHRPAPWPQPPSETAFGVALVQVTDFLKEELALLSRRHLPTVIANRIIAHGDQLVATGAAPRRSDSLGTFGSSATNSGNSVAPEVYRALTHPLLWRFFWELPNEAVQGRALDGDAQALSDLCVGYIKWFFAKSSARLGPSTIAGHPPRDVLRRIAAAYRPHKPAEIQSDWVACGCNGNQLLATMSIALFGEALSFGLVAQDGQETWYWRHPFVGDFLAKDSRWLAP